jgi:hypothetical protein
MYQSVSATLLGESCFLWVFCSWGMIGTPGVYTNPLATYVITNAWSVCNWQAGWYRGEGRHTTIWQGVPHFSKTATDGIYIICWF